ncbi:hypothetical protein C8R45DRAFT_360008 [Mycena sanguinolenta]|nr:hypothetical protein C8R45DRAFT_360008 [Mycena sanguinolenta]
MGLALLRRDGTPSRARGVIVTIAHLSPYVPPVPSYSRLRRSPAPTLFMFCHSRTDRIYRHVSPILNASFRHRLAQPHGGRRSPSYAQILVYPGFPGSINSGGTCLDRVGRAQVDAGARCPPSVGYKSSLYGHRTSGSFPRTVFVNTDDEDLGADGAHCSPDLPVVSPRLRAHDRPADNDERAGRVIALSTRAVITSRLHRTASARMRVTGCLCRGAPGLIVCALLVKDFEKSSRSARLVVAVERHAIRRDFCCVDSKPHESHASPEA